MRRTMSMLMSCVLLFFAWGCASEARREVHESLPHSHYYPFTEVIGNYHLRLIVDHVDGDMALVFEDFRERPAKSVECRSIHGKVTLPDGRVEEVVFKSHTSLAEKHRRRYYTRRSTMPKECGIFTERGEWIKTAAAFTLEVTVSLKGERYQRTFKYEALGGQVPYHRR